MGMLSYSYNITNESESVKRKKGKYEKAIGDFKHARQAQSKKKGNPNVVSVLSVMFMINI